METPERLQSYVTERFGSAGTAWLDSLPVVVTELAGRWGLRNVRVHPKSNRSLVLEATLRDGARVFAKVAPTDEVLTHAGAFKAWSADGLSPSVLEVYEPENAYLMQRAAGVPLEPRSVAALRRTVPVLEAVLQGNRNVPHGVPALRSRLRARAEVAKDRMLRLGGDPVFDLGLFEGDLDRLLTLPATGLLHGDMVPGNVMGLEGHVQFIDPEPMLGPPEWDLATWAIRVASGECLGAVRDIIAADSRVDVPLLDALVAFESRTYLAYALTRGYPIPKELVAASRVSQQPTSQVTSPS